MRNLQRQHFGFQVGDVLVGYTDGITEVQNDQGELWGEEWFEKLLSSCDRGQPKEIIEHILDGVAGFAGGQRQRDDMTLVVMKVEEGFKTQQHFARVFRKMCGASPTEYRQEFLRCNYGPTLSES